MSRLTASGRHLASEVGRFGKAPSATFNKVNVAVDSEDDEEDEDDEDDIFELNEQADIMEEDEDSMNEDMVDEDDDDESLSSDSNHRVAHAAIRSSQLIAATDSSDGAKAIAARPQARTVSISGPDI